MKELFIDNRMRDIEKNKLRELGYKLIEIPTNKNLYPEISSHVDIHVCKIENQIILENSLFNYLNSSIYIRGNSSVYGKYPEDIKYNVCIIGNKAIHNFKYTDKTVLEKLKEKNFELINVNQGYTKCSIAVINENSIIISDKGLYNSLKNTDLNILLLDYVPNIKLINNDEYSNKNGFIGGVITRIDDYVFVSGDLKLIDKNDMIRNFIVSENLELIESEGLDVIDYGGIVNGI